MAVSPADRPDRTSWRPAVPAWALWVLVLLGPPVDIWLNRLARQAGGSDLGSNVDTAIYGLLAVSAATVGAVLASRRPAHPVGWLLLSLGFWFVYGYASWAVLAWRGAPGAVGGQFRDANVFVLAACVGFMLLLTPTGSLPSPRWRWWARLAGAAPVVGLVSLALGPLREPDPSVVNPFAVAALAGPLLVAGTVSFAVAGLAIPVGVGSLVVRFRRAHGVERQQLRWLVVGAAPVTVAVAAMAAWALAGHDVPIGWLPGVCLAVLPLAIGAAILRCRLYDLDRIISRTVTYGLLTVLLGSAYAVVVLGLGRLLPQDSGLVVAAATLAVAALFQPLRRRTQAAVDRRFNRRRHDTAQTIAAFSDRLRQQIDLSSLSAELLAVVDQTMQPTQVALWLRPTHPASGATGAVAARPPSRAARARDR